MTKVDEREIKIELDPDIAARVFSAAYVITISDVPIFRDRLDLVSIASEVSPKQFRYRLIDSNMGGANRTCSLNPSVVTPLDGCKS